MTEDDEESGERAVRQWLTWGAILLGAIGALTVIGLVLR